MARKKPVQSTRGVFVGTVTEDGKSTEANAHVELRVSDTVEFRGRPEHPPLVATDPKTNRFARGVIKRLQPPPPPRPVIAVPKPSRTDLRNATELPPGRRYCPQCGGTGQYGRTVADEGMLCDMCDGIGILSQQRWDEWQSGHSSA
jgi:hypothetical protein